VTDADLPRALRDSIAEDARLQAELDAAKRRELLMTRVSVMFDVAIARPQNAKKRDRGDRDDHEEGCKDDEGSSSSSSAAAAAALSSSSSSSSSSAGDGGESAGNMFKSWSGFKKVQLHHIKVIAQLFLCLLLC
jgi:hypothetical protein